MDARMIHYELAPLGDSAIMISLGYGMDEKTHEQVSAISHYLEENPFDGMIEHVPSFTSVTILYDPLKLYLSELQNNESEIEPDIYPYEIACRKVEGILQQIGGSHVAEPELIEIPVCYGGEFGEDLEFVAEHNQLSVDEVIEIHCSRKYLVYMLGFAPGFPYLGGMDKRIAAPRKQTPRLNIMPGTVGIAGEQTGIYPIETPGGWQLIGRTPIPLFLPQNDPPTLLKAGNLIRFYPVSRLEYDRWSRD